DVSIVNFLAWLKNKDLGFSSISTHRAAIASFFEVVLNKPVGKSPIIERVMRGLFREKPPKAKYTATWDPEKVLSFLEGWDNEEIALEDLTRKLTFLLAICSPRRVSELANLRLD